MTNEAIRQFISGIQPSAVFDETGEWMNIQIEAAQLKPLAESLRESPYDFDYLFCLTCVDWKSHLTMVYHLSSTGHRNSIVIKAKTDRLEPMIDTVSDIWKTANFLEREVYELFGVHFTGHPDLRKLILTDDFEGYPLRKDFEDPVNMIRL